MFHRSALWIQYHTSLNHRWESLGVGTFLFSKILSSGPKLSTIGFSCDYFKSEKTMPFRNAWTNDIEWRLSYSHLYIGLYQVVDAHEINPAHAKSKGIFWYLYRMIEMFKSE